MKKHIPPSRQSLTQPKHPPKGSSKPESILLSLLLFWLIMSQPALAQVMVNLNVDPHPSPRVADWMNRNEVAILTITNTNPALEGQSYRIRASLSRDGNLVVETRTAAVPLRQLPLGTEVFLADEVIPYEALQFYGNIRDRVFRTGMIPAGVYQFCVQLLDAQNQVISSPQEVCRPMFITAYQPPELIYPPEGAELEASMLMGTQFIWSPLTPAPPPTLGVKYELVITEVLPRQSPSQALFINYPLVEQEVIGTTRMIWPPELEPPDQQTQYVWAVRALSLEGDPFHPDNAGFASMGTFSISAASPWMPETEDPQAPPVDPDEEMIPKGGQEDLLAGEDQDEEGLPEPDTSGTLAASDTLYAGLNGEFMVLLTEASLDGQRYTGKGHVMINWLMARVEVEFDSIGVDQDKRLTEGKILARLYETAPEYPLEWALEAVANQPLTHQLAGSVVEWVENQSGISIPYQNPNELTNPVRLPLGLNMADGNQLAITEMVFRPDKSEFNMIAAKTVPPSWGTERLGFRAKNIRFRPGNIEMPPGRIELVEDISLGNAGNNIVFQFKKPDTGNLGCYIEWDEAGFSEYGLELAALFTRDWLIPSPDNDPGKKVSASLSVQGTSWTDLILGGTLEKAEIVGSGGMTILADSLFYDFSDLLNPPGMTFPENYPGDTTELFRGFYMKAFEMEMPETWKTAGNQAPKIAVYDMIIDDMGITLKAEATSVVQFPDAVVADLFASIDTVHVAMVANSLTEAWVKGRIGLPVTKKDSIQNPLQYLALFNNPQQPGTTQHFQFTIEPTGPIEAHLLKGSLELSPNSSIVAYVDPEKTTFDMDLHGQFGWSGVKIGPINDVNLQLGFEGLGFAWDSSTSQGLQFQIGSWSFASAQKLLADFPVTIDDISYQMLSPQPGQLLRGKIGMDIIFNLSEDIGGFTSLGVELGIQDNSQGQKFYPQFLGASLDSIYMQLNQPSVYIEGAIGMRSEDPVFGNGFVGTLHADFKPVGIKVDALAEFGNTNHLNGNQLYRYWRVQAQATLPAPGVTFLPGLAFRGFGGGAFFNMEASLSGTTYAFSPKKSALGFQALAVLATSPKEESFNADVGLLGQFSNSGGLTFIGFTGDFWVGADMSQDSRNKAKISGGLSAQYNFPDKHFNFSTLVNVNAPPITTPNPVSLVLDVDGKNNQWFFKFGEPNNLNTVRVFGINLYEYLMLGNQIPVPGGFTPGFANAYKGATGFWPAGVGSGGVGQSTTTGSGFALGIGFRFDHNDQKHLTGNYYLAYQLGAGAELHLSFMEYLGSCSGFNPIGINGWRARGGLGFYGYAGAQVKRIGGVLKDKTWNIASLSAGASVYGEFPNPWYVTGAISGQATVFDVIDVSFHKTFEAGTKCSNSGAGPGVPVVQGDVAADQLDKLIQYVKPTQTFNFPEEAPLVVKFGLTPGEVFDVSEQQADGTIKMRSFRMDVSRSLVRIMPDNNQQNQLLNTTTNNLGEHLYTVIGSQQPLDDIFAPAGLQGGLIPGGGSLPGGVQPAGGQAFTGGITPAGNIQNGGGQGGPAGPGGNILPAGMVPFQPMLNYPPEPSPPSYGNLPPDPPQAVNNLVADSDYIFTVTATLKEFVSSPGGQGNWVTAQTLSGQAVTESVTKSFRTGPIQIVGGQPLQMSW